MSVATISIRDLRPRLARVLKNISDRFDRYIITKRGNPEAVIMNIEDYESILETMDIQSDKVLMKRLLKAEKEKKARRGHSLVDIRRDLGLV